MSVFSRFSKVFNSVTGVVTVLLVSTGAVFAAGATFSKYVEKPLDNERRVRQNTEILQQHTQLLETQTQILADHTDDILDLERRVQKHDNTLLEHASQFNAIKLQVGEVLRVVTQSRCLMKAQLEGTSWDNCID